MSRQVLRNQPCACGSGKRFKHCCGALVAAPSNDPHRGVRELSNNQFPQLMSRALAAQTAGRLSEAEGLYRQALSIDPRSFDALHMLGVTLFQAGRAAEACRMLVQAWPLLTVEYPPFSKNLGLALAAVAQELGQAASPPLEDGRLAHLSFHRRNTLPPVTGQPPKVSIVAPCYNHERYVRQAIASVARQTYQHIELIIIDDGSGDGSVSAIQAATRDLSFPHEFHYRENRGAHATLNEGISMASGDLIGILNTDDLYDPDRVDLLVRAMFTARTRWAFSNLAYIDEAGEPIRYGESARVDSFMRASDDLHECRGFGAVFPFHNIAVSTGNLFFEKSLWHEVGGFEPYRYNHDWAFCLNAILVSEPAYVDEPAYRYRLHDKNTISESHESARREADQILGQWHRRLTTSPGPLAKALRQDSDSQRRLDLAAMSKGMGHLIDPGKLLRYASELGFPLPSR